MLQTNYWIYMAYYNNVSYLDPPKDSPAKNNIIATLPPKGQMFQTLTMDCFIIIYISHYRPWYSDGRVEWVGPTRGLLSSDSV